jgi:H+/gluconate symporter-like permease
MYSINWETLIINILTALPGVIIAIATLIKMIKTKTKIEEETSEIKTELHKVANGNKVVRAPRRSTDPCPGIENKKDVS